MEKDMMLNLEQFNVYSWKEEEYHLAVQNDKFYSHVKTALDSGLQIDSLLDNSVMNSGIQIDSPSEDSVKDVELQIRKDFVRSKFYFAGASARCMFSLNTSDVIQHTGISVAFVNDIFQYLQGTLGDQSNNVVNRLFSSSLAEHDIFSRKTSIISRFAGVMLAVKKGPDLIRRLAEFTLHDGNHSMDGWILEMWFFASLCHGGVKLFDTDEKESENWPEDNFKTLDINSFPPLPETGVWFKPIQWNQGGFDAIFLDKGKGLVRFVQVIGGDTHLFKIEYFYSFLLALGQSPQSFEITCLEIIIVVDQKKRSTFKLVKDFGWKFGKELDKVKIGFIKGWCD
jgi:hypothetical protein